MHFTYLLYRQTGRKRDGQTDRQRDRHLPTYTEYGMLPDVHIAPFDAKLIFGTERRVTAAEMRITRHDDILRRHLFHLISGLLNIACQSSSSLARC